MEAFLDGLIDYAGLFPPAGLGMAAAIRNYADYVARPHSRALGRFVVSVSRLGELADCLRQVRAGGSGRPMELSVLAGNDVQRDYGSIGEFNAMFAEEAVVRAVETKASSVFQVEAATRCLPDGVEVYVEVPVESHGHAVPEPTPLLLNALSGAGVHACHDPIGVRRTGVDALPSLIRPYAKVRTGGITSAAFPSSEALARFIELCHERNLAFKATAGLHHAIRSVHPLTYDSGGPCGTMHGFLNVFLAAAWIHNGMTHDAALAILVETDAHAFSFDDEGVQWRGERLSTSQIAAARRDFALSFGSCSFTEPLADLQALGLIR